MKTKLVAIFLLALIIAQIVLPNFAVLADEIGENIQFNDANLKKSVLDICDANGDGEVSQEEILELTSLYLYQEINDYTGLECAKNLENLTMYNAGFLDINILSQLDNLESLTYDTQYNYEETIDIDNLVNALKDKNVYELNIHGKIEDITTLQELKSLQYLDLDTRKSVDYDVLNKLTNLAGLAVDFYGNYDLSKLGDFPNLANLEVKGYFKNIESLAKYQTLENFSTYNNFNEVTAEEICNLIDAFPEKTHLKIDGNYLVNLEQDLLVENENSIQYNQIKILQDIINPEEKEYAENLQISKANPMYSNSNEISIDENNKTFIITPKTIGKNSYIIYIYAFNEKVSYGCSLRINCNVVSNADNVTVIDIPDENLKKALIQKCDLNKDGQITAFEMENITGSLDLRDVKDLTGIRYAKNLSGLYINFLGEIPDLSTLGELNKLTYLALYPMDGNNFDYDCAILERVTSLTNISLQGIGSIKNVESINELNIDSISLYFNNATAVKSIEKLKNTNKVSISTSINDYSEIRELFDTLNKTNFNKVTLNLYGNGVNERLGGIKLGETKTVSLNELGPVILNSTDSTFRYYDPNYTLSAYGETNKNATIELDQASKQLKVTGKAVGEESFSLAVNSDKLSVRVKFYVTAYEENEEDKKAEIAIKDKKLENFLLEKYDIDDDNKITRLDMKNIYYLDIQNMEIENIECLKEAINLEELYASENKIKDISPLAKLENLSCASLFSNYITDISCLKGTNAYKQDYTFIYGLSDNFIDLSNGSENLTTLEELATNAEDVEGDGRALISYFASSQRYGKPEDFDNVVEFGDIKIKQKLIELGADLNKDGIITRRELFDATKSRHYSENGKESRKYINEIDLSNMGIEDISGLEYLGEIENLNLSNNNIRNIEPLAHLFAIKELNLSNNKIESINCLPYYGINYSYRITDAYEKVYDFSDNIIKDFSCIKNWVCANDTHIDGWRYGDGPAGRILNLNFENNLIEDISCLNNITTIKKVNLSYNNIKNIDCLKDFNFTCENSMDYEYGESSDDYDIYKESLYQFEGINLSKNYIDEDAKGTIAAQNVFNNKGVQLNLESQRKEEYALVTKVKEEEYIENINNLEENESVICIVLQENPIIEKNVLDAIKGKDITITFTTVEDTESEGIEEVQWKINGKDIANETKDIQMNVTISQEEYSEELLEKYEIDELYKDKKFLKIEFANNGLLPGTMDIRLKTTEDFKKIVGTENLKLYYIHDGEIELVQENITLDEEGYYNLILNHNSEYWLTEETLKEEENSIKGDINKDGKVTLYDAFTILRKVIMMASEDELTEEEKYIMDYNGDKKVTLYDAFSFLRLVIMSE